jgi:hypothetical protein
MNNQRLSRRRFLTLTGLGAAGFTVTDFARMRMTGAQSEQPPASPEAAVPLETFAENVTSGGPPKDGIPAIDEPRFVAADEMNYLLKPEDRVFVLSYQHEVRVYPQLVLVWHEIVNDTVAGEPLSVTYCPLTGSVVAFKGRAPDGTPLTFGTSGKLVNSNLLMYDRQTDSHWPQILGQAISGVLKGTTLEEIPFVWTTWERWKAQGVDAPVLSAETGHLRSYGQDPYGAYASSEQGYYEGSGLIFPVLYEDQRFGPKEVVVGVKVGEDRLAIPKETALKKGAWNLALAGQPLVAVRDPALETVWVFSRQLEGQTLSFQFDVGNPLRDQNGGAWHRVGPVLEGPSGARLPAVTFYDAMWFAWYAFFPDTEVVS